MDQLRIYGATADFVQKNYPKSQRMQGNLQGIKMWNQRKLPTEQLVADPHTNAELQGNAEDQKLSKLCCDVGLKIVEKGQFFITLDEEGPDEVKNLCREYTSPRNKEASRVRGWILGNTKIGPVLDVKVCFLQGRHGIEVMFNSLFRDGTVSWVRIVSGKNKYVAETSETISLEGVHLKATTRVL